MSFSKSIENPAPTSTRVEESTTPASRERIHRHTESTLARAAADQGSIERRLRELDQEWDIERALQTNFAIVNWASITLGALVGRSWFLLTGVATGFMARHALKGWCPPVSVLRRLGFRTSREINQERYALKALRGDFQGIESTQPVKAFEAAAVAPES
jgi:hypothetical protein